MNCEELNIDLMALAEKTLDEATEIRYREHINSCKACKSQLEFLEGVMLHIDSEKKVEVTPNFSDRVVEEAGKSKRSKSFRILLMYPVAAAAVIVLGLFTGIFISNISHGDNSGAYADLSDEFYYANEIHLETIESFFLTNDE